MVSVSVRPVSAVTISSIVGIPRVSLGISVGARLGRGSFISRPLSIVAIVAISVTVVTISVRPVGITVPVVTVPGVSLGIGVGARFGRGTLISRSLSVVTISIR